MRERIFAFVTFMLMMVCSVYANENHGQDDWNLFIEAIIQVESGGNVNAKSGSCAGPMQIMPICVKAVNGICEKKKNGKKFTLKDRYNREKSIEMFKILQDEHNPSHDFRKACNLWNGGSVNRNCGAYYRRVMKVYDRLRNK